MRLYRPPQPEAAFTPGDVQGGYYNDLRDVARQYGSAGEAAGWLELLARRREQALPVTLLQLGLGAWQLASDGGEEWQQVVRAAASWAVVDMDGHGRFAHHQPMPHTYDLEPPWHSAMAQGQGVSLLVRAAAVLGDESLAREALRAAAPLVDPALGLVAATDDGPVLQEYPTTPPAHVLNGWMWALWGLFDASLLDGDAARSAGEAFDEGAAALAARIGLYDAGRGWSRYDLYPHPVVHVASPFYHRLHIAQLRATATLVEHRGATTPTSGVMRAAADRWQEGFDRRTTRYAAVARKVGFRLLRPRARRAA